MKINYKLKGISYKWMLFVFITYNSSLITHHCFAQVEAIAMMDTNKIRIG